MSESTDTPTPSEVWVCGIRFEIELFEVTDHFSENLGEMIFNRSLIRVWSRLSPDMMKNIVLHEVNHVAFELTGLTDGSDEEETVDQLTTALLSTLRDPRNKPFVDWLLG